MVNMVTVAANFLKYSENQEAFSCPYYKNIISIGTLISPNVTLPSNSLTTESFEQVLDYMAVHELTAIEIDHSW